MDQNENERENERRLQRCPCQVCGRSVTEEDRVAECHAKAWDRDVPRRGAPERRESCPRMVRSCCLCVRWATIRNERARRNKRERPDAVCPAVRVRSGPRALRSVGLGSRPDQGTGDQARSVDRARASAAWVAGGSGGATSSSVGHAVRAANTRAAVGLCGRGRTDTVVVYTVWRV